MELYINDFRVDLNERLPFPLTYNISDIKDLSARKGNNSKTITIPGTKGNLFLMYNAFSLSVTESVTGDISSFDFDPTVKVSARYYEQGILQFNGYCQLTDCEYLNGDWAFNIVLFSDQIDYMIKMGQVKINELDWSEYDHDCTRDNQTDTWSGTIKVNSIPTSNKTGANWDGIGYYYGLIDYGYDRATPSTFNVEHIHPQVFCYDILSRLFTHAGITWNSAFLESQTFKRLLLAHDGGDPPSIDAAEAAALSCKNDEVNKATGYIYQTGLQIDDPGFTIYFGGGGNYKADYINQDSNAKVWVDTVTDPSSQITGETPFKFQAATAGLYQVEYVGTHDVTFDFTIAGATILDARLRFSFALLIYRNGSLISFENVYQGDLDGATGDVTGTIAFTYTKLIDVNINDQITMRYRVAIYNSEVIVDDYPSSFSTEFYIETIDAEINMNKLEQVFAPGSTVKLNQFLPDMDGATYFKGLVQAFNLYCKPSTDDPTILDIEPLNDFYGSTADALNWSDKVDYSKSLKVTPTVNFVSKEYLFKFADDTDYFNQAYLNDQGEQYGSYLVDSQNQFNKDTTEFVLPFSQKLLVNIPVDETTYTGLIMPRSFQVRFNDDGTSEINLMKGKPFIVQLGPMTSANWTHIDENGTGHAETDYPYVGHLNSLTSPTFDFNWGVPDYIYYEGASYTTENLYFYHDQFMKEIVSKFGKQLNCYIKITPDMINQLDFRNLINIDGVVYRLQKIENWDSGKDETTAVELIRIIKSEGLFAFFDIPPFNPLLNKYWRITESEKAAPSDTRETEDNQIRRVQ